MNKLDLLWALENQKNEREELERDLKILYKSEKLNALEEEMENLEISLRDGRERSDHLKKKSRKIELDLRDYDFTIRAMDKDLYGGEISDPKELEYLSGEIESLVIDFNALETDLLELMEEEDRLEREIQGKELILKDMEEEFIVLEERKEKDSDSIRRSLDRIDGEISQISLKIPQEDLQLYLEIRRARTRGIVPIDNNICRGCYMKVPSYIIQAIREKLELKKCENCGRILYYMELD